jgi:ribosomal protein L37AE/L43A
MAQDPACPYCRKTRLIHTGALWMCPGCGLMITRHALAAETGASRPVAGTGQPDGPDGPASG